VLNFSNQEKLRRPFLHPIPTPYSTISTQPCSSNNSSEQFI